MTSKYLQDRYYRRKGEAIAQLGGKCSKKGCESTQNLEFDHINREGKLKNATKFFFGTREKFLTELKKCQLLCRQHHIEKSILEQQKLSALEVRAILKSTKSQRALAREFNCSRATIRSIIAKKTHLSRNSL